MFLAELVSSGRTAAAQQSGQCNRTAAARVTWHAGALQRREVSRHGAQPEAGAGAGARAAVDARVRRAAVGRAAQLLHMKNVKGVKLHFFGPDELDAVYQILFTRLCSWG